MKFEKIGCFVALFYLLVGILLLVGEVMCIAKAINSDWNPIGKREFVYTLGAVTGTGSVIGWFNVADDPEKTK